MAKRRHTSRKGSSRKWLGKPMTQATPSAAFNTDEEGAATRGAPRRINEPADSPTKGQEKTGTPAADKPDKGKPTDDAPKKQKRSAKETVSAGVAKLKEAVNPSEDEELKQAAAEDPDGEAAKKAPVWSRPKWLVTVAAIIVGALIAVLAVYLSHDDVEEQKLPSLTVGGATDAGRGFDYATMGSCLHWDIAESDGSLINFRRVNCDTPHRFEVAGVIDLNRYPNQRFDKDADPLSPVQVESLRQGLCRPLVDSYLPKGLDPSGRFDVGILEPDATAWGSGVRTLVCGIQASVANSDNPIFKDRVGEQSQALTWAAGTCLDIIPNTKTPGHAVNCSQKHVIEVIGSIDLNDHFKGQMPTTRQQNAYSEKRCVEMANKYVGNADKLRKTTLTPVWSRVSLAGWNAGSRIVNCYLSKSGRDGLAELQYTVKSPKLLINGKKPPKVKPLPPKDNQQLPDMSNDPLLSNSVPSGF